VIFHDEYARRRVASSDIVDHMPRLFDEACRYGGVRVLELGVRSGNSTAAFLHAAELTGGSVVSVDLEFPQVPEAWLRYEGWTVHVGDDLALEPILGECDVLFVDTSHYHDHTLAELRAFWSHVAPGGVVLMHDTELEHPADMPATDPPFPVRVAIETFCAEVGVVPEFVSGCYGLGIIHKEA
jgi:cephalosporin hydroxylase